MKYFTLHELCASATARRLGILNVPDETQRENLIRLVDNVLDPLREAWGAPIIVTSGFRCPRLNTVVGGARRSQHMLGEAADIRTVSNQPEDNRRLRDLLITLGLPFDQLIDEYGCSWLHVSYREGRLRHQALRALRRGGKTIYCSLFPTSPPGPTCPP